MLPDLTKIKAGPVVSRACYVDPGIFEAEQTQIFEHAWLFVAHESEFARPGDFRTTDLAGQPVLAVMGPDRRVRVLFNSCRRKRGSEGDPLMITSQENDRRTRVGPGTPCGALLRHYWQPPPVSVFA